MLTVEPIREWWNLTVSKLGTVRTFKEGEGMDLKLGEFETLT